MNRKAIFEKFGDDYLADDYTFRMGIDQRFTAEMAQRFSGKTVLETCTGAGFTTVALARVATHVVTIEVDAARQAQARSNLERAGLSDRVTFVLGDVLERPISQVCPTMEAAFLDPDWAVSGPDHVFRFRRSNTEPPADTLLEHVLADTGDVALVMPPLVDEREFTGLPLHEQQSLFLDGRHELYCLYFGRLGGAVGATEFHVGGEGKD